MVLDGCSILTGASTEKAARGPGGRRGRRGAHNGRVMRVTGTAQREAWLARRLPPVERVRPDVWSVPVPIPNNPLRYTLCYVLMTAGGPVVVDPGWDTAEGWDALLAGLGEVGVGLADVVGVALTHVHPDHHGLTARVRDASGAWVAMHRLEVTTMPSRDQLTEQAIAHDQEWLLRCGLPEDLRAELGWRPDTFAQFVAMAQPDVLLEDAGHLPGDAGRFRAVWTPGHTPGHLCFHDTVEDVLLTGDHVLPRISPNVGLQPHDLEPPLSAYLRSLEAMTAYRSAEVLPAHEYRFLGVDHRAHALVTHHHERCQEIHDVISASPGSTAWEVAERISWSGGWSRVTGFMRRAAVAETGAHLEHLRETGRATVAGAPVQRWSALP